MTDQVEQSKIVSRFSRRWGKGSTSEIIPSKPGLVSRWIFPILAVMTLTVLWMLWWIHHPDIINGYAVLRQVDAAEQVIQLELDNPRGGLASLRKGQLIRIKAARKTTPAVQMLKGRIDSVTKSNEGGKDILLAKVQLGGPGINGPVARAVFRNGADLDLVLAVNDMPLLMRILHTSSNTVRGNN